MSEKPPLVSICVPVYNNARYLRECLDSIAAQTYENIEVLIGDDGSTDETATVAQEYHARYGYRVYRNPSNRGAAAVSTTLVQMARGSYIAVYHSDDRYEKTIVEDSVKVLESDANVGLVGTMATIITSEGEASGEFRLHNALRTSGKKSYAFDDVMLGVLKNGGHDIIIVTPSVMARKDCYRELGTYSEKYKDIYDYEMWLRIATRYRVAILDKKLMQYRMHENQISQKQTNRNTDVRNIVWVIRDYRQFIADGKLRKYCDDVLDTWFFRTAKKQNYRRLFSKSNETMQYIESGKYIILKMLLKGLNRMQVPLKMETSQK